MSPYISAIVFALYAMHDQLVENAALAEGQVSGVLRRFQPSEEPVAQMTAEILRSIADNLDEMHFGNRAIPLSFKLIQGGVKDGDIE